jgi:dTDP-L-rhamnose 4-epimerase
MATDGTDERGDHRMSPDVLITGGAGFIGCALSEVLVRSGAKVVAVDVLHPQVHTSPGRPRRLPAAVELFPMDVANATNWDSVLQLVRPDTVVHLAAETGTGQSLTEATRHATVNVVGTSQMLDAFTRHDVRPAHLLLASSRAVYGEGLWQTAEGRVFAPGPRRQADLLASRWDPVASAGESVSPLPNGVDLTPAKPTNIYGATKLAQEMMCSAWAAAMEIPLSVLRLQNVYGPGQSLLNSYTGIVTLFARLAKGGQILDVYEDGRIIRDFVYIDDVIAAMTAAIRHTPEGERFVDVGAGVATTIEELASATAAHYGAPEPVVSGRFRAGDVRAAYADTSSALAALQYQPAWPLSRGLESLFAWIDEEIAG